MDRPSVKNYRSIPTTKQAMKFETNNEVGSPNMDAIVNWCNQGQEVCQAWHNGTDIFIRTLEGQMKATVGDYIIRGLKGEFYPCKPDIFEASYAQVPEVQG